jgi:hypothetical protein
MAGIGLADTIGTHAGLGLKTPLSTALYNPLAAVPSLHAGFALTVGVALACAAGRPIMRAFALAWPALVAAAVVATGNHFVFDVAAGAATVAAGYGVAPTLDARPCGAGLGRRRSPEPSHARGQRRRFAHPDGGLRSLRSRRDSTGERDVTGSRAAWSLAHTMNETNDESLNAARWSRRTDGCCSS